MPATEPIDIVYTWVDDQFPGYRDLLAQYVATSHDTIRTAPATISTC